MNRTAPGPGHLDHGLEQLAPSIRRGFPARGVEPAAVLEFQFRVEAEEVGCAHRPVGFRDLLGPV